MAEKTKHYKTIGIMEKTGGSFTRLYTVLLVFFFVSGLTGLIYQILWARMIESIIGSAPFAVSIVLTVFMGGLGLGSYLASRMIDRISNSRTLVKLYGFLELAIALYALCLPFLLSAFKPFYAILYNRLFEHFIVYNLLTFAGCTVLLLLPVVCMGATLPVLSRFIITNISRVGSSVGWLYGVNTIGSAVGTVLCGFIIIQFWGVQSALYLAVILNTIIGISSILLGSGAVNTAVTSREQDYNQKYLKDNVPDFELLTGHVALLIFAISGFCAMSYEVIWTKLLGLIVGPTTYSFTVVLATFITGLALGSIFFGWLADKTNKSFSLLLYTQIAAAVSALFISQIMGNSQIFFAKLIFLLQHAFISLEIFKTVILFLFMVVPTFLLGATFPLVGKLYTRSISKVGRSIGFAYSINAVGAVLGSFCAGFILIPFLGKENSLRFVISVQLLSVLGIGSFVYWKTQKKISQWIPLIIPLALGLIFILPFPHWNRNMLSIGKYHRFDVSSLETTGWLESLFFGTEEFGGDIISFGDGIGGFTAVSRYADVFGDYDFSLFNSGKSDASTYGDDMVTQVMLAHFPMLFHPDPEQVMVLGLASGITAGEVLHYPVEKLDILEINNQVVSASDYFIPWNNSVLANPKTELIIQDGRAHLELTNRRYDVIISEPSNPWMAGLASLFTQEFFHSARERLQEDGIFVQWIHSYQMNWWNFALIGRTFANVFPNSMLVSLDVVNIDPPSVGTDFLLVGFNGDKKPDDSVAAGNLYSAQKSENITLKNHRILYRLIAHEDLHSLFGEGPLNTEKMPVLEFSAPRMMYIDDISIAENISTKRWVRPETQNYISQFAEDIDAQIDFAGYVLSFIEPFQNMIELSDATSKQRERFSGLLEMYCSEHIVTDFSFIDDEDEIQKRCIMAQIDFLNREAERAVSKAPVYSYLGSLCYKNDLFDRAFDYFSLAVQAEPDDDEAHYYIGNILFRQENMEQAVLHYKEAIRIHPEAVMAHNNLGNAYARLGEYDMAIIHYRQALEINPEFAIVHKNLGTALLFQGKREEGERHIREALRLDPESVKLYTQD